MRFCRVVFVGLEWEWGGGGTFSIDFESGREIGFANFLFNLIIHQILAKRGTDSSFVVEANFKAL